jgi:hypothetical protein
MLPDLLSRKQTAFVLWRPGKTDPVPRLILGRYGQDGSPDRSSEQDFDLRQETGNPDLWVKPAAECRLSEGQVYYYFFEVTNSRPGQPNDLRLRA